MLKRLNPSLSIGMWDLLDQIRPMASWLPHPFGSSLCMWAQWLLAFKLQGSVLYALHADVVHWYCSKPLHVLDNRSGELEWARKVPLSPLVVLGCFCVVGGEL